MPKISRNKLEKSVYDEIVNRLMATFAMVTTSREITELFDGLFTKTERLMFAKRLAIAVLLERGYSYGAISKKLKVSSVTIGFIRNGMLKENVLYEKLIQELVLRLNL